MNDPSVRSLAWGTILLFVMMTIVTVLGVPLFAYFYDYSPLDWALLIMLYIITGLGITVGYHRMIAHRSFECRPWVKVCLLIAGGWALQNSALLWCADHIRHHARTDSDEDPYNAQKGFWHSHCGWLFEETPHRSGSYEKGLRKDRSSCGNTGTTPQSWHPDC
jgi:stearoyl-CoA desaturase (delta-9 desaturase)